MNIFFEMILGVIVVALFIALKTINTFPEEMERMYNQVSLESKIKADRL
jgi:hypothetical protein